jgi:dienelactone hydrolase
MKSNRPCRRRSAVFLLFVAGLGVQLSVSPPATIAAPLRTTLAGGETGKISFQTETLNENQFLTGADKGAPAVISGELSLPREGAGRLPAVILLHPCTGVSPNVEDWAKELNRMGIASFLLDSFSGRGIDEVCTSMSRLSMGSRVVDTYRALEILATHPRIDPSRIALLGFSHGGRVTLQACMKRFRKIRLSPEREFAAYLAFYPGGCNVTLLESTDIGDRPIRIFHGSDDDWTPIGPCRAYIGRLNQAGKDAGLLEYAGAQHAFDIRTAQNKYLPRVVNPSGCFFAEREPGQFANFETGQPYEPNDRCFSRGATIGYDREAHLQSIRDVKTFLQAVFNP